MKKKSNNVVIILTTVPKRSDAVKLSRALVKKRIAACATIFPRGRSFYQWERKMVEGNETLIMCKTTERRYSAVEKSIKTLHPYEVPEILAVKVKDGYSPYLGWVSKEVDD